MLPSLPQQPSVASAFLILYVATLEESLHFYKNLPGCIVLEHNEETFAVVNLAGKMLLGLWTRHTVFPPLSDIASQNTMEISLALESLAAVNALALIMHEQGTYLLQDVLTQDFGTSFVITDPDNNRIRFYFREAR